MDLGFTGTHRGAGMTEAQRATVILILASLAPARVHHGSAPGSDTQFHGMARRQHLLTGKPVIVLHPGPGSPWLVGADERLPVRPNLDRNRDIVAACDVLLATPYRELHLGRCRHGTCTTARYALDASKPVIVVTPLGDINFAIEHYPEQAMNQLQGLANRLAS